MIKPPKTMVALALCLLWGALIPNQIQADKQNAGWELNKPITWTFADALSLYSQIMTLQMLAALPNADTVEGMELVLADVHGKTTLIVNFSAQVVSKLQTEPPAEQVKGLQKIRTAFHTLFTKLASGEYKVEKLGTVYANLYAASHLEQTVSTYLASRKPEDFVLRVGFSQDGLVHLYAIVSEAGVQFSPDAPTAK